MGDHDIGVELESLGRAVDAMSSQVVDEITSLSADWITYLQGLDRNAWSSEQACAAFALSYGAAIEAYDQVLQGVRKDVVRYRDELQATCDAYRNQDDAVMGEMNRRLAKLDDVMAGDDMGRIAYGQRSDLDDGTDVPASAPADTSPGQ